MTIDVYLDPCTINSRKVLAGLQLMDVKYNENFINFFEGQQKSEEFKKINPCATVPAAVDGDLTITESNAILAYAADKNDSKYYPKDLKVRAKVNQWLLWEASAWFGSCYIYLIQNVVQPLLGGQPDQKALEDARPRMLQLLHVMELTLSKEKYLAGDQLTIADIAVAAPMHLWKASKLPLDDYPGVVRWIQEIEKVPAWVNTQKAVEKALLPGAATANGESQANGAQGEPVKASINYTKDTGMTELYFYDDPKAANIHEPGDDPHEMTFHPGWDHVKEFSYDTHGFSVEDFNSKYSDWQDDERVRKEFYPDVVEFLKKTTGAKRILVFDHTIRTAANAAKKLTDEKNTSQRNPVMLVHCDYTAESGPLRVKQLLESEADELLKNRVAFLNVWKPLNVVEERPLAMCDVKSAPESDFFKLYLRYRDRTGENYVMRHNDKHKWWYFPKMTPEQCIILKTYESETDGRARFVGHTAFEDPTTAKDAPMRESIEIRTIAFY